MVLLLVACGGDSSNPGGPDPDAGPGSGAGSDAPTSPIDATVTVDPATTGPNTFTTRTAAIPGTSNTRTVTSTVFTPSSAGPRALVVVSPGFQLDRAQYTSYAEHLASWGFVVILTTYAESGFGIDHERIAADVPKVVDWALADTALAIDAQKIALAGHSLGGKISVRAASLDARVKAVVGWDPVDSTNGGSVAPERVTGLTAKLAIVGETTNATCTGFLCQACAPAAENFATFYTPAPAPALQITVTGADHMDWVDDPTCFVCGLCDPGTASPDVTRTITRRLNVAWLRRHLFADTSMDTWLTSPPEAAAVVVSK